MTNERVGNVQRMQGGPRLPVTKHAHHVTETRDEAIRALAINLGLALGHAFLSFQPGPNTMKMAEGIYDRLENVGWVLRRETHQ